MRPDEWLVALGFDIYDKDAVSVPRASSGSWPRALVLRGLTVVNECGVWQRWERDLRRTWARLSTARPWSSGSWTCPSTC